MRYLFDLDGVLCEQREDGEYQYASPMHETIEKLNWLHDAGHEVWIWTARGAETGEDWEDVTRKQLDDWGVKYDRLLIPRPFADVYVDDRAIRPEELE